MPEIHVDNIIIPEHQRETRPWKVTHTAQKMSHKGYNISYPITLEADGITLNDGGHRLAAAKIAGITKLPYVTLPEDESPISHAIRTNRDGTDTEAHDVFDLAELCYNLARDEWTGQQIADELGWNDTATVTRYSNIKIKLHSQAWNLARWGLTRNLDLSTNDLEGLVNSELTIVNWSESHFRTMLKHLAVITGAPDRMTMRAQIKVVQETLDRFADPEKKVTAKWLGPTAIRHAWHVKLAKYLRDNLIPEVSLRDHIKLLSNVYANVFGKKLSENNQEKFEKAVAALNEDILGVTLYHDDALQRIPLLDDGSVNLVINDPPYNVTDNEWDKIGTPEEFIDWARNWLAVLKPKLAEDYHLFVFCSPVYLGRLENMMVDEEWPIEHGEFIVWEHRNLVAGRVVTDKHICNFETILHCGTHAFNWSPDWNDKRFAVQRHARPQSNYDDKPFHPTAKPLALIEHLIQIGSKPADIILDMFAGGGTTGKASTNIGQRRCILVEQNDEFCTRIENRLNIKRHTEVTNAGN